MRIMLAARKVLSRRGYEQTAIKDIAKEARVAPGLVHYYFKDKDDLIVAVIRDIERDLVVESEQATQKLPKRKQGRAGLDRAKARLKRHPAWFRLRFDLFPLALRNKRLKPHVGALLESGREKIADIVMASSAGRLASKRGEAELLASILNSAFDGLALQKLVDPAFPIDDAYVLLEKMAEAVDGPGRRGPKSRPAATAPRKSPKARAGSSALTSRARA